MDERFIAVESVAQFRSKSILAYNRFHSVTFGSDQSSLGAPRSLDNGGEGRISEFLQSAKHKANAEALVKREKYTGQMSAGAKKRLTKAISLLIQSSAETWVYNPVTKKTQPHKLSFITLTLPNVELAKDAKFCHKQLLQPMLRIMRDKYKMKSYLWKAELQENESIHYHLTTDLFLPWEQLRQHWNAITRNAGMLNEFRTQYGHDNPNSVDIHAVNKVNDLEAYLVKYISKDYQNEKKLDGKIWDCSKNLKSSKYFSEPVDFELHTQLKNDIDMGWATPIYRDRCVILRYTTTDYYLSFSQTLIDKYYSHLTDIREWTPSNNNTSKTSTTASTTVSSTSGQQNQTSAPKINKPSTHQSYQTFLSFGMTVFARS